MSSIQQVQLHKEASERQRDSLGAAHMKEVAFIPTYLSTGASAQDKRLLSPNAVVDHSLSHFALGVFLF